MIPRRQRRRGITKGKEPHEQQKQVSPVQASTQHSQNRRTDDHAQSVGTDDVPDLRLADTQIRGHGRHQAHDHKFTGTDTEASDSQGKQYQPGKGTMGGI